MTIEKLLSLPSSDLDKLTNAELEVYFAPYLNITRPKTKQPATKDMKDTKTFESTIARLLRQKGLNMGDLLK